MSQEQAFRFLDLPPELRNRIYGDVFHGGSCKIDYSPGRVELNITYTTSDATELAGSPGIITTNKQIYAETRLNFYENTKFDATSRLTMKRWLGGFDEAELAAITQLPCRCYEYSRGHSIKILKKRTSATARAWLDRLNVMGWRPLTRSCG